MNKNVLQTIGFIGAGRTATALARGMDEAGFRIRAVASRSFSSAQALASQLQECEAVATPVELVKLSDIVFLTVPDDVIASLVRDLPWRNAQGAVHCSGALSLDVLAHVRNQGALAGGLHPLQTFATRESSAPGLAGSTFAVDGDGELLEWLNEIVKHLAGHAIHIRSQDRSLYHAAAVMSCGYVTILLDVATTIWEAMGFHKEEALAALLPLAYGTLRNIEAYGTRDSATGPIIRCDTDTVRRHLVALVENAPGALPLYRQAGLAMVSLASERGSIGESQAQEIRDLLNS